MNFFSGLEKFGFSEKGDIDIMADDRAAAKKKQTAETKTVQKLTEKDLILDKTVKCPVCDREFSTKRLKTGKAKRLEPDFDLKPNFDGVDSLKYDVTACPCCGYAALNTYFEHLSMTQIRLIKQQVAAKYKPVQEKVGDTWAYDYAIEHFKLALISAMVKRAKLSEKAYICLKTAWLIRDELKTIPDATEEDKKKRAALKEEYNSFYSQAYEGFLKARSTEMPPYCGMNSTTLEFMLANMSIYFRKYGDALKLIGNLITNPNTNSRVKDKCADLKEQIVALQKKEQEKK